MTLSNFEKNRLKEKYGTWAVVTGATSGIGFELAERLAESGLNLVINARNEAKLAQIAVNFKLKYGIETLFVAEDVSNTEGVQKIIIATKDLDIGLFVAAAGFGTSGLFINNSVQDEVNMLRVNCEAVLILTHHFSKIFVEKKRGGIILFSSIVAFQGVPLSANYAATKAYIQSLAEALAVELKPFGVDVLSAIPGPVKTGFEQRANMQMDKAATPAQIGIPILKALGRKTNVRPGFLAVFLGNSLRTVPRWIKVKIMTLIMSGMTKHQNQSKK